MGMETFTIMMVPNAGVDELREFFLSHEFIETDIYFESTGGIPMEFKTTEFIVEALITNQLNDVKVSLRFALPNTDSVDNYFRSLVCSFLNQWPSYVYFMSGTRSDLEFSPSDFDNVLLAIDDQIPKLRAIWQSRAGTKTGRVRVADVCKFMGWT